MLKPKHILLNLGVSYLVSSKSGQKSGQKSQDQPTQLHVLIGPFMSRNETFYSIIHDFRVAYQKINSYFSTKTYVVDTHNETVLLSVQTIC